MRWVFRRRVRKQGPSHVTVGLDKFPTRVRSSCSKANQTCLTSASGWLCPSAPFTVAMTLSAVLFSQSHHFYSDARRFLYRNQSVHNLLLVYRSPHTSILAVYLISPQYVVDQALHSSCLNSGPMLPLPPSSLLAPRLSIYNVSAWNCFNSYATSVFDSVNYEIELQDICNLVRDNVHPERLKPRVP